MKETTTLLTEEGYAIEFRNPRMMTPAEVAKLESLSKNSSNQFMFFMETCLVNKEDMKVIVDMSFAEVDLLLAQVIMDFEVE